MILQNVSECALMFRGIHMDPGQCAEFPDDVSYPVTALFPVHDSIEVVLEPDTFWGTNHNETEPS